MNEPRRCYGTDSVSSQLLIIRFNKSYSVVISTLFEGFADVGAVRDVRLRLSAHQKRF